MPSAWIFKQRAATLHESAHCWAVTECLRAGAGPPGDRWASSDLAKTPEGKPPPPPPPAAPATPRRTPAHAYAKPSLLQIYRALHNARQLPQPQALQSALRLCLADANQPDALDILTGIWRPPPYDIAAEPTAEMLQPANAPAAAPQPPPEAAQQPQELPEVTPIRGPPAEKEPAVAVQLPPAAATAAAEVLPEAAAQQAPSASPFAAPETQNAQPQESLPTPRDTAEPVGLQPELFPQVYACTVQKHLSKN